jgi:hypothetical protein
MRILWKTWDILRPELCFARYFSNRFGIFSTRPLLVSKHSQLHSEILTFLSLGATFAVFMKFMETFISHDVDPLGFVPVVIGPNLRY